MSKGGINNVPAVIGQVHDYTQSLRQVIASLVPVALSHPDQDEVLAVIKEAMGA